MNHTKPIRISGSLIINNQADRVFNFFANPLNDRLWRKEVRETIMNGPLQLGVLVSEYSYLSPKAPRNLLEFSCVKYEPDHTAVFETLTNARFYEKSERLVAVISSQKTRVTYTLEFDSSIVKYALGFSLPVFLISFIAKYDMKKYLRKLKAILEAGTNSVSE